MCGPVLGKIADPLNLSRGNGEALAKPWENPTKALDPLGIVAKDPVTKTVRQSPEAASNRYQYGQVVRPTQLNIPSPGEGAGASSSRNPGLQYLK